MAMYARGREEQADFYADEIVAIADTEPYAAIARVRIDAHMNGGLSAQYARARSLQADALDDDIADTVNQVRCGEMASTIARARDLQADALDDDIAGVVEDIRDGTIDPQAGRVIIWAHQWRAAKMRPRRYGDKIDHKVSGALTIGIRQNERVDE